MIRTNEDKYYLNIPIDITPPNIIFELGTTVSLDPGEKIFQTCYDNLGNSYMIGENDSKRVDKLSRTAQRMRDGIERINNPDGSKIFRKTQDKKKRKMLRKVAARVERKAKDLISDIHRKTAKFLTDNYNTILIPVFKSQKMAEKTQTNGTRRKLGRDVTRRLLRWTHYKFRMILQSKSKIAGKKVFVVEEPYTTKTCGKCFYINHNIGGNREFNCPNCGSRFHRDINAARNILLHNWERCGLEFS